MSSSPERRPRRRLALVVFVGAIAGLGLMADPMRAQVATPAPPSATATSPYAGIGREASPKEIAAWDIDVRPDFKGLPKGEGSVGKGMEVWESKCESCHGTFGESNQVFAPIVGGTTKADIERGRVARLTDAGFPGRTTLMKVANVSTLWDYVNRAMPWNQPKSLSTEEVYAVTAYMLNMGGILPDDFVMSDRNIGEVQQRMPNRDGLTTDHGLWPGRGIGNGGKPDVKAVACMKDCATEPSVASILPDYARSAHGNLAEQNRLVGAQRGADTAPAGAAAAEPGAAGAPEAAGAPAAPAAPSAPAPAPPAAAPPAIAQAPQPSPAARSSQPPQAQSSQPPQAQSSQPASAESALPIAQKNACTACHAVDRKLVGPGFREIAARYKDRADADAYLAGRIRSGGQGVWGAIPMPPQSVSEADARAIAAWLKAGAR